jgi:hypothetical protein
MATYVPAKVSTQYIFYVSLVSQADTKLMKVNPTIAAGDFKVSIDGGALANLGTLPTVTPASSAMVKITLSTSEMAGANATVVCSDAAGAEWCDLTINIPTASRQIDDLAYPATSGRSMVVDASGLVDANTVKIGPTGAGTAQTARDIGTSVLLSNGTGTGQLDFTSGVVKANATQILGTAVSTPATAGILDVNVKNIGGVTQFESVRIATATAGTATTLTLDASASAIDNYYVGSVMMITSGANSGVCRTITGYVGSTKVATFAVALPTTADATPTFVIKALRHVLPGSDGKALISTDAQDLSATLDVNTKKVGGTTQTARDIGASVLLSNGTGTGQLKLASGYVAMTWADVAAPTTAVALTGTTIATTQKVDVETIKTNPVVNAGTVTFPTTATLASTTNITAGTITTATNVTTVNGLAAAVITAASIAADAITDAKVASDVTIASVTGSVGSVTGAVGSVTGNVGGSVASIATGGISAASFAAGAIDAAAIATDAIGSNEISAAAVTKIQTGLATPTNITSATGITLAATTGLGNQTANITGNLSGSVGSVTGAVGSVTAGVIVTTNNDKTGYALSSAAIQAIWDALTSALTTVGSIGKAIVDLTGRVVGTIATGSHTAQSGDNYARLGAPAGASVSADVAAINAKTTNLPAAPASTTNITAGTITTVTNLTNAPTAGDLTATMKTSVTTAATAATPIAASVTGSVGSVVSYGTLVADVATAVWSAVTRTLTAASDSSGITTLLSRIIGTLATGTHNPQTGDAYARLGAPAGASTAADIAAVNGTLGTLATAANLATVASYLDTEIAAILTVANRLDTMLELDGAVYRLTINALEQSPAGGGGGGTDWTADERTALRTILGIPVSGTTPEAPGSGAIAAIKTKTDLITAAPATAVELAKVLKSGEQFTAGDGTGTKNVTFTRV